MATRRERLEARAERRRQWSDAAAARGDAAQDRVHEIADRIPFGQPILVGHHSEGRARRDQARMDSGMRRAVDEHDKAARHEQAAGGIEEQLARSIYSDDVDAVEQLRAKAERLEAERDRIKAYNASCRKGTRDLEQLDERQRGELAGVAKACPYQIGANGSAPAYWLSNLGGNINRNRKRLAELERVAAMQAAGDRGRPRVMRSRYAGECADCGEPFARGATIRWFRVSREAVCERCSEQPAAPTGEVGEPEEAAADVNRGLEPVGLALEEYANVHESGQLSLGVPGEQLAVLPLPDPQPKDDREV